MMDQQQHSRQKYFLSSLALSILLTGCSLAPRYELPAVNIPVAFKEAEIKQALSSNKDWKAAEPADAHSRGEWWAVFADETLNQLEQQAIAGNQNLQAAAANLKASRALRQAANAQWFPQVNAGFGPTRQKPSPASLGLPSDARTSARTLWREQVDVSYEVDLFGRVASSTNAATADTQQREALFHLTLLALQADVAQGYFLIRQLDAEQAVYRSTLQLLMQSRDLMQKRLNNGDISELDLARSQTELLAAQSDALSISRSRADAEHALAVLLGKTPASFSLAVNPLTPITVKIPAGLPSSLLERRPDIAAAERGMAASNARIGVARAAFFPNLSLTGALGYESSALSNLNNWSSRTFLLGPLAGTLLSLPLFDGGQRKAGVAQARATYEESVANYRQTILNGFREVEDGLSDQRILSEQIQVQEQAVQSAKRANYLSHLRYKEGATSYLDVIDADRSVLLQERSAVQLNGERARAAVSLIRALGGGWQETVELTGH